MEFQTITPLGDGRVLFITPQGRAFIGTIDRHTRQIVLRRYSMIEEK